MYPVKEYFERFVRGEMYHSIDALLKRETRISCALLLATYTEIMGGLMTGDLLKEFGYSKSNFDHFINLMGHEYQEVNEKVNLHKRLRSGLVHEFAPKKQFIVWLSEKAVDGKPGVAYYDGSDILNVNLNEYYRDWKKVVEDYYHELMSMTNPNATVKFLNSVKSLAGYLGQGFVPDEGTFSRL